MVDATRSGPARGARSPDDPAKECGRRLARDLAPAAIVQALSIGPAWPGPENGDHSISLHNGCRPRCKIMQNSLHAII